MSTDTWRRTLQSKRQAPCKNCTKRYFSCHSECSDYIAFKGIVSEDRIEKDNYYANRANLTHRVCNGVLITNGTGKKGW